LLQIKFEIALLCFELLKKVFYCGGLTSPSFSLYSVCTSEKTCRNKDRNWITKYELDFH